MAGERAEALSIGEAKRALSHGNVMTKEFRREVFGRGPDDDPE